MNDQELLTVVQAAAAPLLAARGMEQVELTGARSGARRAIRLLVYTPAGVTLEQCAELNRVLCDALEQQPELTEAYVLEVASPGLDRPLTSRRDFERVLGQWVTADLRQPVAGRHQWAGRVTAADETAVTLETTRHDTVTVPLAQVARARLQLRW